jgi:hypothetical protein
MNSGKIRYKGRFDFSIFGESTGKSILILEDLFSKNSSMDMFCKKLSSQYNIIHTTNTIDSLLTGENRLIDKLSDEIEEAILRQNQTFILFAFGYSSALGLNISMNLKDKIESAYFVDPVFSQFKILDERLQDFGRWWIESLNPIDYFSKIPEMAEFFDRYWSWIELFSKQEFVVPTRIILTNEFSNKKTHKLAFPENKAEIFRVNETNSTEFLKKSYSNTLISWLLSEKR